VQGRTGSVVLRQAAANLTPLVQPAADGKQHLERSRRDASIWLSNAALLLYSQTADIKQPYRTDTLIRSEFEYRLFKQYVTFVRVPYKPFALFCLGKTSVQINNDADKVNSVSSRFFQITVNLFEAILMRKLWPLPPESIRKHQRLVHALKFVACFTGNEVVQH